MSVNLTADQKSQQAVIKIQKLIPYVGEPPDIYLTDQEREVLQKNQSVYKKVDTINDVQSVIIFKVNAQAVDIWKAIKNYPQYSSWIKEVKDVEIYKIENANIFVRFRIKHWLLGQYEYYVNHFFAWPQENWATWTLDENFDSDFASSIGFWRVFPVDDYTNQSYVAYSANLLFKKRKSKFIRNRAIKSSLKQASGWVKKYSEIAHSNY